MKITPFSSKNCESHSGVRQGANEDELELKSKNILKLLEAIPCFSLLWNKVTPPKLTTKDIDFKRNLNYHHQEGQGKEKRNCKT